MYYEIYNTYRCEAYINESTMTKEGKKNYAAVQFLYYM